MNPLIDCIRQAAALKMNFLANFDKDHCHTGILTDRDHILPCDFQILLKLG